MGSYQEHWNATSCESCEEIYNDPLYTSNGDRTGCIKTEALANSIFDFETMRALGINLGMSIAIAVAFAALAMVIVHLRRKEEWRLANFTMTEAIYFSLLPGFSFGADCFLTVYIWDNSSALGAILLISRLLHICGG